MVVTAVVLSAEPLIDPLPAEPPLIPVAVVALPERVWVMCWAPVAEALVGDVPFLDGFSAAVLPLLYTCRLRRRVDSGLTGSRGAATPLIERGVAFSGSWRGILRLEDPLRCCRVSSVDAS